MEPETVAVVHHDPSLAGITEHATKLAKNRQRTRRVVKDSAAVDVVHRGRLQRNWRRGVSALDQRESFGSDLVERNACCAARLSAFIEMSIPTTLAASENTEKTDNVIAGPTAEIENCLAVVLTPESHEVTKERIFLKSPVQVSGRGLRGRERYGVDRVGAPIRIDVGRREGLGPDYDRRAVCPFAEVASKRLAGACHCFGKAGCRRLHACGAFLRGAHRIPSPPRRTGSWRPVPPTRGNRSASVAETRDSIRRLQTFTASAVRRLILEQSKRANVGHIGSALSVADILTALYGDVLRVTHPDDPQRDRFVMSKGHAALALYAALHLRGWIKADQFNTYAGDGTLLGMHPENRLVGVDFSTGSLGHGLSLGVGAALAARRQGSDRRVFVLLSDAECNEGSVWKQRCSLHTTDSRTCS